MARFDNSWNNSQSSFWVNKVDFVKLKNIQLGYSVPERISNKYGLKKAYIYINAQNMYTLVSNEFDGYDPEKNTFDSSVTETEEFTDNADDLFESFPDRLVKSCLRSEFLMLYS